MGAAPTISCGNLFQPHVDDLEISRIPVPGGPDGFLNWSSSLQVYQLELPKTDSDSFRKFADRYQTYTTQLSSDLTSPQKGELIDAYRAMISCNEAINSRINKFDRQKRGVEAQELGAVPKPTLETAQTVAEATEPMPASAPIVVAQQAVPPAPVRAKMEAGKAPVPQEAGLVFSWGDSWDTDGVFGTAMTALNLPLEALLNTIGNDGTPQIDSVSEVAATVAYVGFGVGMDFFLGAPLFLGGIAEDGLRALTAAPSYILFGRETNPSAYAYPTVKSLWEFASGIGADVKSTVTGNPTLAHTAASFGYDPTAENKTKMWLRTTRGVAGFGASLVGLHFYKGKVVGRVAENKTLKAKAEQMRSELPKEKPEALALWDYLGHVKKALEATQREATPWSRHLTNLRQEVREMTVRYGDKIDFDSPQWHSLMAKAATVQEKLKVISDLQEFAGKPGLSSPTLTSAQNLLGEILNNPNLSDYRLTEIRDGLRQLKGQVRKSHSEITDRISQESGLTASK